MPLLGVQTLKASSHNHTMVEMLMLQCAGAARAGYSLS